MNPEEKAELKKELVEEFVLIPKNRWYYLIGGAVGVVVVAFGIGMKSVFEYVSSQPAEDARKRILTIVAEAESYRAKMLDGLPRGSIIAWNGQGKLGPEWIQCDGRNGTPDLTGRFIMGVSKDAAVGSTGGSETHSHTAGYNGSRFEARNAGSNDTGATRHDTVLVTVTDGKNVPPFAALIYIMKV